ncbi:hypothetical protein CA606_18365 [Caulobacter vibrioides]|uniref:Uncharacterized protein n=1 Tax=Caulobacter vibrioides TaxID=155892 RepID=A0A290MQ05_CAUVI|nr:hypothetical protein [Caulobacter vibrioides]ATC34138.1 hypothetical protein CA606_18365 [Caulobacter vibrioides]
MNITVIVPEKRDVLFHLTPFAKGCASAAASDRKRRYLVTSRRPGQAIHALLTRLGRSPDDVEITPCGATETAIHPIGNPFEPYAFVWEGLTFDEVATALSNLKAVRTAR